MQEPQEGGAAGLGQDWGGVSGDMLTDLSPRARRRTEPGRPAPCHQGRTLQAGAGSTLGGSLQVRWGVGAAVCRWGKMRLAGKATRTMLYSLNFTPRETGAPGCDCRMAKGMRAQ